MESSHEKIIRKIQPEVIPNNPSTIDACRTSNWSNNAEAIGHMAPTRAPVNFQFLKLTASDARLQTYEEQYNATPHTKIHAICQEPSMEEHQKPNHFTPVAFTLGRASQ